MKDKKQYDPILDRISITESTIKKYKYKLNNLSNDKEELKNIIEEMLKKEFLNLRKLQDKYEEYFI